MDISKPIPVQLNPAWYCTRENSSLCMMVGSALEEGTLFQKDPATAAMLYREAMKAGDPAGGYFLGNLYENGIGGEKNLNAAKSAYLHSAKMGNVQAYLALGYLLDEMGQHVQAFRWYKAGHEAGIQEASHQYALCLYGGKGTEEDKAASFPIFKSLANQGNTQAAFFAGLCYHQGYGTPVDYIMARHFYQVGADEGDPYCWNQLGSLALDGLCGEKDPKKALDCFLRAGKLGYGKAYGNAAWLYQTDAFGTGQDMKKAFHLYQMAAKNGAEDVAKSLQWVEDHLSGMYWPEDIQNGIVIIDADDLDNLDNLEDLFHPEDPEDP